jgi:hypothetical protein
MPTKPSAAVRNAKNVELTGQNVVSAVFAEDPALAQAAANAGVIKFAQMPGESRQTVQIPDDNSAIMNIYSFITGYEPNRNAFLYALMNRIGMTILTSKMWNSPLAWTLQGRLEFGESIEEIFVNLIKVRSFDPTKAPARVFERNVPDVRAAFHVMNWQKEYPLTITTDQLRQAFLSWQGIVDLVQGCIQSMYKSLQKDMYETTKYMIAKLIISGQMPNVQIPDFTDPANMPSVVKAARSTALNMTILGTQYNMAHVYNAVDNVSDLYIIMSNDLLASQDVDVLAAAFNMDRTTFYGRVIGIDSFSDMDYDRLDMLFEGTEGYAHISGTNLTNLQKVGFIACEKDFFQIWENFQEVTDNYNGSGLYWNYFLHAWYTFSVSPFAQGVLFDYAGGEITSVKVVPATANVAQGSTVVLGATVEGTGIFNKDVTFSISGQTKEGTRVVGNQLTIAVDEPASTQITVTAKAVDGTTGTGTITVVAR